MCVETFRTLIDKSHLTSHNDYCAMYCFWKCVILMSFAEMSVEPSLIQSVWAANITELGTITERERLSHQRNPMFAFYSQGSLWLAPFIFQVPKNVPLLKLIFKKIILNYIKSEFVLLFFSPASPPKKERKSVILILFKQTSCFEFDIPETNYHD